MFFKQKAIILTLVFKLILQPLVGLAEVESDFKSNQIEPTSSLEFQLDEILETYHRRAKFNGNVIIEKGGQVIFEQSLGLANQEWEVPHTSQSKFMIASLSKSFTAALLMSLVNEGLVSLDDLVSEYIELPQGAQTSQYLWEQVKVKDLLLHTSGLKRDSHWRRSRSGFLDISVKEALLNEDMFASEPGKTFIYSNFAYHLLARLIVEVQKSTFGAGLEGKILYPAKLYSTNEYHRSKIIRFMSDGYLVDANYRSKKRCCDDASVLVGSAGLYSTARDLLAWLNVLKDSQSIYGFDLLAALLNESVPMGEGSDRYAYGLMVGERHETDYIYHTGHEFGYMSYMALYPKKDLKIVILSNKHDFIGAGGDFFTKKMGEDIADIILK